MVSDFETRLSESGRGTSVCMHPQIVHRFDRRSETGNMTGKLSRHLRLCSVFGGELGVLGDGFSLVAKWRVIYSRLLFRLPGSPTRHFAVREDLSRYGAVKPADRSRLAYR